LNNKPLSKNQEMYFQEYEKYKHIEILTGDYKLKTTADVVITVMSINLEKEEVAFITKHSGVRNIKTLHWARKNLIKIVD
jgi:hypothetical protein